MDEPLLLLAWTLGGTVAFGLLGALFGGLTGWLSQRAGLNPGSVIGRRVADALAQLREQELTDSQKGTLVGAVDGALFLGLLGTLVGLVAAHTGRPALPWLRPLFLITLTLVGGALLFGALAAGIIRLRIRAVIAVSLFGVAGALLTAQYVGVAHIVPGSVLGMFAGVLVAFLLPR